MRALLLAAMLAAAAGAGTPGALLVDVSDAAGIDFRHHSGAGGRRHLPETMGAGGCVLDYDGDGRMDVFLVQSGSLESAVATAAADSSRLFRNRGGGRFEDVTAVAGVRTSGYGQGAVCADYDGDGATDIYVTHLGPNQLFHNQRDGRFREVAAAAGVADPHWSVSAAFFDADADGDLDLYVANYLDFTLGRARDCRHAASGALIYCHPDVYPAAPDTFYRNRGDGSFEDATRAAGLAETTGKGLGVVVLDYDDDGRPDVYVANDSTPNFLHHNLGGGRFEEVGLVQGVALNEEGRTEAGMGVDAGDVDGDGRLDIIVANLSLEANALYLGGRDQFSYATRRAGLHAPSFNVLGFGIHFADLDSDGDLDLVVANGDVLDNVELVNDALHWRQPGQVFANDGRGHFSELSAAQVGDFSLPRVARGSMLLDFDDDGRLDLLVAYNDDRARLFHNTGEAGHWIGFRLRGRAPNLGAVGARVTLEAGGQRQLRELRAGSGYASSSDPRLHFGLGAASRADRASVRWPNGQVQVLTDLAAGRYHELVQP